MPVITSITGNLFPVSGQDLLLTCNYNSTGDTNVTWWLQGSSNIISASNYLNQTTLRVQNITFKDTAKYTCVVNNVIGNDSDSVSVTVNCK